MAAWRKSDREGSWASDPNLAVYLFVVIGIVWLAFQIWARLPHGPPPPSQLDPILLGAFGFAISAKSVEKKQQDNQMKDRQTATESKISALEDVATEAHPDIAAEHIPPLKEGKTDEQLDK